MLAGTFLSFFFKPGPLTNLTIVALIPGKLKVSSSVTKSIVDIRQSLEGGRQKKLVTMAFHHFSSSVISVALPVSFDHPNCVVSATSREAIEHGRPDDSDVVA